MASLSDPDDRLPGVGHLGAGTITELANERLAVEIRALGAALHTVRAPDRAGRFDHVHLALPPGVDHRDRAVNPYLGATVGRWANRIAGATCVIDGRRHHLDANEGPNHLHGGTGGLDQQEWAPGPLTRTGSDTRITLYGDSPDGDQGYPGSCAFTVTYALSGPTLSITHTATTDAPTIVNLCSHGYWNLGGRERHGLRASTANHRVQVHAERVLPRDEQGLPTADTTVTVDGSPFDLRVPSRVGDVLAALDDDLDHTYDLRVAGTDPTAGALRLAAVLRDPDSGRALQVHTDQPAVQVYDGKHLGPPFAPGAAICLEPQRFPDAPNRPGLGPVLLLPDAPYRATTTLTFTVEA